MVRVFSGRVPQTDEYRIVGFSESQETRTPAPRCSVIASRVIAVYFQGVSVMKLAAETIRDHEAGSFEATRTERALPDGERVIRNAHTP